MATNWIPDEASLSQLVLLLRDSMSPVQHDRETAMNALKTFQSQPEFLNYLCYILIEGASNPNIATQFQPHELSALRGTAGLLLKNTMLQNKHGILKHDIQYVKNNIIHALYTNENDKLITNSTGIVITTLFATYYRQERSDITGVTMLRKLIELAAGNNVGAIKALSKIMEDNAQFFQLDWQSDNGIVKPIKFLIENFLKFMINPTVSNPEIRAESIKCINFAIGFQLQDVIIQIDEYLANIFKLAEHDDHDIVRAQICVAFTTILEFRPDKLTDNLIGIVQFMLHLITSVQEETVALEACEFLYGFSTSSSIPRHILQPFVKDIVPVLLTKMVFDEDSILIYESHNEDDAYLDDKDEDIKPMAPRIVKKSTNSSMSKSSNSLDNESSDSEDDHDDDEGDGDVDSRWTLRKCSAATLDIMTNILPRDVIEIALPYLREHLTSEKWFIREATILALGAMSEGIMKFFHDQLPSLIPFLVEQLKDQWAPVRKIVCWTLSRFASWILQDHTEFLIPVLEPIIDTLLDKRKDVQESAISSVAVFIENCDSELIETLLYSELLNNFDRCFQFYKKKNLIILYDAVGRFAEKVNFDDAAMQIILPHLINKWATLQDNDKELWPLLECLSCVVSSLGEKFLPMAPDVYARAYRILCHCVEMESKSHSDPTIVVPEKDFTITSIDLIDGLVQGLGSQCQPLLFPNNDNTLLRVILECLNDPVHEVRQSTFALLGDIVTFCDPKLLSGTLSEFLRLIGTEIMHNDDIDGVPSVINAVWSLGLISERVDLSAFIIDLSRILLDLFTTTLQFVDTAILENIAITIGRMGITHPEVFANGAFANDSVWNKWTDCMSTVESCEEKSSGYMGFIKIVNLSQITMSDKTLHKVISGLSINVEAEVFGQDVLAFLMRYSNQIQNISSNLNTEEITLLQKFSN
ncbi:Kap104p PWA37_004243 [Arxiozyma heterogenica]|uniref:Kap104p n=1 Tax=Arxiozyma heterogenica TaxID=278026 RepID=UPI002EE403F4